MNAEIDLFTTVHSNIIEKFRSFPAANNSDYPDYEILPDVYFDLAFLLSERQYKVVLAGPRTEKTTIPIGDIEFFAVRFRAGRLPGLVDIKPAELMNSIVSVPKLFGTDASLVCEQLMSKKDLQAKQSFLESFLRPARLQSMINNKSYNTSVEIIESCEGQIQVAALAGHLNISRRSLERIYMETLGISPKKFIRLVRFQNALSKIKSSQTRKNYADIAYDSGYCDQSHFVREIKAMTGVLPSDL